MKGKHIQKHPRPRKTHQPTKSTSAKPMRWHLYAGLGFILLLSFLVYLPVLQNGFVWDDGKYIQHNPLLIFINLKDIFSTYVLGNYHPLTILVLAIEYKFFGLNPAGYHATNLLLHLLNVLLVFYATFLLSRASAVAFVAALLFGVHPLHVESVAWASELKDLLYTFFFLASFISYLKYLRHFQSQYLVAALLLFLLSLLSKAMAASLPVVFLLTDYFNGRRVDSRSLLEKAPFFILAIVFGVVAVVAQRSSDSIQDIEAFAFQQRIVFACYGLVSYLFKLFLPLHLSAYYPYPIKSGADLPIQYYLYVPTVVGLVALVFYSLRSSAKVLFGMGFFAITVFLVLQLLPVGGAVMADRYSYIPSIGVCYLAGEGSCLLWKQHRRLVPIALLSIFAVFFCVTTSARCSIWKDAMTLWSDVISQNATVPMAYFNRGVLLQDEGKYNQALEDYDRAIELDTQFYKAYYNRGIVLMALRRNDEALSDFTRTIEGSARSAEAYVNRGNILRDSNRQSEALKDYNEAIRLQPQLAIAYFNRGTLFMNEGKNEQAVTDYDQAIELNPSYVQAYHNRGNVFSSAKRYEEAIRDYSRAIDLRNDYALSYYGRGLVEYGLGRSEAACSDMKRAESLGYSAATNVRALTCK